MDASTKLWLQGLPKAELHLHLEGTVTPETLVKLSQRHDAQPLTLPEARALYAYKDFLHFLKTFKMVLNRMLTTEDYALVAREMMSDLRAQGVVHAEVYIAWGNILRSKPHLTMESVMAAVDDVRVDFERGGGPSVLWIADASRQEGQKEAEAVFTLAAKLRNDKFPSVVGIGIGGDEVGGPIGWFHDLYLQAKAAGLRLTAHAGEATGPTQGPLEIRAGLEMGVERFGHALAAQHDEELMQILREKQTPLEINVTSNILTRSCPSLSEHPLPMYIEKGLMCTLNSDDPAMFGSRVLDEYILAHEKMGIELGVLKDLARNSFRASFLGKARKAELQQMVDAYPDWKQ